MPPCVLRQLHRPGKPRRNCHHTKRLTPCGSRPWPAPGQPAPPTPVLVARSRSSSGYFFCPMTVILPCHHCLHQTRGDSLIVPTGPAPLSQRHTIPAKPTQPPSPINCRPSGTPSTNPHDQYNQVRGPSIRQARQDGLRRADRNRLAFNRRQRHNLTNPEGHDDRLSSHPKQTPTLNWSQET